MLNETVSGAMSIVNVTTHYISDDLYSRGFAIIDAPFRVPDMLWMLIPILATLLFMEFYFGRYKEEELGWNTAFGNSLVLTFVAIDLFRRIYEPTGMTVLATLQSNDAKILIAMVIFGFALLLAFTNFFHFISKKVAYAISSAPFIHLLALLGIIVVYSDNIAMDWTTLFAGSIVFLLANFSLHLVYLIVPSYRPPLQRIINIEQIPSLSKNKDD
jgi:hypothetical protein